MIGVTEMSSQDPKNNENGCKFRQGYHELHATLKEARLIENISIYPVVNTSELQMVG